MWVSLAQHVDGLCVWAIFSVTYRYRHSLLLHFCLDTGKTQKKKKVEKTPWINPSSPMSAQACWHYQWKFSEVLRQIRLTRKMSVKWLPRSVSMFCPLCLLPLMCAFSTTHSLNHTISLSLALWHSLTPSFTHSPALIHSFFLTPSLPLIQSVSLAVKSENLSPLSRFAFIPVTLITP